MQSLNTLLKRWANEDVGALPGVEASSVQACFASLDSVATADVIALYAEIGGMDKMDKEYWRHWSLSEIESENKSPSPSGVLFADYMISCWCYRVKAVSQEVSAVYIDFFNDKNPTLVANSLEEFFSMYLKDPDSVLFGPPAEAQ
jgi:hypothetical protein